MHVFFNMNFANWRIKQKSTVRLFFFVIFSKIAVEFFYYSKVSQKIFFLAITWVLEEKLEKSTCFQFLVWCNFAQVSEIFFVRITASNVSSLNWMAENGPHSAGRLVINFLLKLSNYSLFVDHKHLFSVFCEISARFFYQNSIFWNITKLFGSIFQYLPFFTRHSGSNRIPRFWKQCYGFLRDNGFSKNQSSKNWHFEGPQKFNSVTPL